MDLAYIYQYLRYGHVTLGMAVNLYLSGGDLVAQCSVDVVLKCPFTFHVFISSNCAWLYKIQGAFGTLNTLYAMLSILYGV